MTSKFYDELKDMMTEEDFKDPIKDISGIADLPKELKTCLYLIILNYYYETDQKSMEEFKLPYSAKTILGKGSKAKGIVIQLENIPERLACYINKYMKVVTKE